MYLCKLCVKAPSPSLLRSTLCRCFECVSSLAWKSIFTYLCVWSMCHKVERRVRRGQEWERERAKASVPSAYRNDVSQKTSSYFVSFYFSIHRAGIDGVSVLRVPTVRFEASSVCHARHCSFGLSSVFIALCDGFLAPCTESDSTRRKCNMLFSMCIARAFTAKYLVYWLYGRVCVSSILQGSIEWRTFFSCCFLRPAQHQTIHTEQWTTRSFNRSRRPPTRHIHQKVYRRRSHLPHKAVVYSLSVSSSRRTKA